MVEKMGMTIDTVDKWLKIQRQNLVDSSELARDKKIESLDTAVSYLEDYQQLMRKYEKIRQIIRDYDVAWESHHMKTTIDKIRKVIEDGNENNHHASNS